MVLPHTTLVLGLAVLALLARGAPALVAVAAGLCSGRAESAQALAQDWGDESASPNAPAGGGQDEGHACALLGSQRLLLGVLGVGRGLVHSSEFLGLARVTAGARAPPQA